MKRKISVRVVFALIFTLVFGSINPVLADTYVGESTACNTIAASDSTGYTIGGANHNSSSIPDYYLRFTTYSAAEGSSNAKTYNETSPTNIVAISNTTQYTYAWNCKVNITEHNNYYGWYTTDISRVLNDGTIVAYTSATTYVSPIDVTYAYNLLSSTAVSVSLTYNDVLKNSIATEKYASGNQSLSYFEGGSGTSFTGTSVSLPSAGHYTIYAKDSAGYEKTLPIEVNNTQGALRLGVTQVSTVASTTPTVNVMAWTANDVDNQRISLSAGTPTQSTVSDSSAPESSVTHITYQDDSLAHSFYYLSTGQDFENGDSILCSYWYKSSDSTNSAVTNGGIHTASWQGVSNSILERTSSTIKDDSWHFGYIIEKLNTNLISGYLNNFTYSAATGAQDIYLSGLHITKIPNGSDLSSGVVIKKWAYGTQTASYFDAGNGTSFSGNSFSVAQNGVVSVFAKDASGNELVRTYTVSNYDPYAGDTTPPTGSYNSSTTAWTTGNVTINVTATDAQSGVKSITAPGGTVVTGNTCSYTATGNGTYNFTLTDNAGNTCTYPVTVSNIDRSVSVSYSSSTSYTVDPNNTVNPTSGGEITLTNNNTHVGAQVTLQSLTSALSGTNGFTLGAQIEESASGNTTWSEIDNKSVQLAGGASTVLGVLSPGGTGHIKLVGQLGSLRWPSAAGDTGNIQLTFTAVS
ncbi:hypothetical protein [Ethanoligenens sp.]|uniref:hypothetical protein n=1 Tax=Ethanoligenens sp. TaxID=2099655 RepID=UPI0039ED5AB7